MKIAIAGQQSDVSKYLWSIGVKLLGFFFHFLLGEFHPRVIPLLHLLTPLLEPLFPDHAKWVGGEAETTKGLNNADDATGTKSSFMVGRPSVWKCVSVSVSPSRPF